MIIGNLSTFPARANTIEAQIARILPQVDRLNICFNEYGELPQFVAGVKKIFPIIPDRDLKATGKFYFRVHASDLVFLFDDDLPYPRDYVSRTLSLREWVLRNIHRDAIVGYHGSTFYFPGVARVIYRALVNKRNVLKQASLPSSTHCYYTGQKQFMRVAQIGTGTSCLRGDQMPPLEIFRGAERHDDVRFAQWCYRAAIPQIILPRENDWIARGGDDEHSIWNSFTKKLPMKRSIEVLSYCFGVQDQGRQW
jgi:hypothetical protein